MLNNTYNIGNEVKFAYGLKIELVGGVLQSVRTSPAIIIITGAKFEGEWMYFERYHPEILYPESSAITE